MTGIQEILVLVLIVLAVFFIPRITARKSNHSSSVSQKSALSGKMRLAIMGTVVWPLACAVWLKPWNANYLPFLIIVFSPLVVFWGGWWVLAGFQKKR